MATVVLTAAKGRPGVSTWATALAFAWPAGTGREVVLVDADVSGGGPLSAFQRYGLGDGRGLLRWSTARNGGSDLAGELHSLDAEGSRRLLAGLPDPVAGAAVAPRWSALVVALRELTDGGQRDVLVDLGRLGSRHEAEPLLAAADLVTFSLRTDYESVHLTRAAVGLLPPSERPGRHVAALQLGDRQPYSRREVAAALGLEVLAVMPESGRAAARLLAAPTVECLRAPSALVRAAIAAAPALLASTKRACDV